MDINTVISLVNQFETLLSQAGVELVYLPLEDGNSGNYYHEERLIEINEELDSYGVLASLAHECVHLFQLTKGWLIGRHIKNPNLSQEENDLIEELVMGNPDYSEDVWELEFPAWKLELYPTYVLKLLEHYVN